MISLSSIQSLAELKGEHKLVVLMCLGELALELDDASRMGVQ